MELFVAQRLERMHSRGAQRRNRAGGERDAREGHSHDRERDRVAHGDTKDQARSDSRERQAVQLDSNADAASALFAAIVCR